MIAEKLTDAVVFADPDGKITGWNHAAENLNLRGFQLKKGQHLTRLIDDSFFANDMVEVLDAGISGKETSSEISLNDSETVVLFIRAMDAMALIFKTSDHQDKKSRPEGGQADYERLSLVASQIENAVIITDASGNIEWVNDGFTQLTGYSAGEVEGKKPGLFLQGDETNRLVLSEIRKGLRSRKPFTVELLNYHKNGSTYWIALTITPVMNDRGEVIRFIGISTDISKRVEAQERLKQKEATFRGFLEALPDAVVVTNENFLIRFCNPCAEELFGFDPGEYKNKHIRSLFGEDTADYMIDPGYASHPIRLNGINSERNYFPAEVIVEPAEIAGENAMIFVIRDISELVKAELANEKLRKNLEQLVDERTEALKQSQARYQLIAENMTDMICLHAPDGTYEFISPSISDLLGYVPDEMVGQFPYHFFHPDDVDKVLKENHVQVISKQIPQPVQYRFKTMTGEYLWVETTSKPILSPAGNVIKILTATRNISKRKKVEELLQKRNELIIRQNQEIMSERAQLKLVMDNTPDLIFFKDEKGLYEGCNRAFENFTGFTEDAIIGKNDDDLFPPEMAERVKYYDGIVLNEHRIVQNEAGVKDVQGQEVVLSTLKSPYFNEEGKLLGIIGISRDVTTRRKGEEKLHEALKKERELGELKSKFVSIASHQFRTPLTVIQTNMELLDILVEKENSRSETRFNTISGRIRSEVKRLTELLDDVLVLGRINQGNLEPDRKEIDLRSFFSELKGQFDLIQKDERRLELEFKGIQSKAMLDEKLLTHAFSNLISNAFKYSAGNRQPLLKVEFKQDHIQIMLRDYGIGIPEADMRNLFKPFFRASNVRDIEGTGLGLNIAYEYIRALGGEISIESEPAEGTTIIINLPYDE